VLAETIVGNPVRVLGSIQRATVDPVLRWLLADFPRPQQLAASPHGEDLHMLAQAVDDPVSPL